VRVRNGGAKRFNCYSDASGVGALIRALELVSSPGIGCGPLLRRVQPEASRATRIAGTRNRLRLLAMETSMTNQLDEKLRRDLGDAATRAGVPRRVVM
jgi:hypothetical protein